MHNLFGTNTETKQKRQDSDIKNKIHRQRNIYGQLTVKFRR